MPSRSVHTVVTGDTFESLSNQYFGEPSKAGQIQSQNAGVGATLIPGTKVIILGASEPAENGIEGDGMSMRVGGTEFKFWTSTTLTMAIDEVSTVRIVAPYSNTPEFRDLIQPFSFPDLDLSFNNGRLFRGTMINAAPEISPDSKDTVTIQGYSSPGVLGDCQVPAGAYPLQFRRINIGDIADKLAQAYGVTVVREGGMGGVFRRVKIKRTRTPLSFLTKLAQDRGLLLRSNTDGDLVIASPPGVSAPVASLHEDKPPVIKLSAAFIPQSYFSHVTGVRNSGRKRHGNQVTVQNQRAIDAGVMRAITRTFRNISKGELNAAVQALAGRALANSVVFEAHVVGWKDAAGKTWAPGTTIELTAPRMFVPEPFDFQIRKVELSETPDSDTAKLTLMLPGALGGTPPDMLPWQL